MSAQISQLYSFLPTNFTGCVLWLDGSDLSTLFTNTAGTTPVSASGQSVAHWKDKSSQANNATTASTQPTVVYNSLNGLPVISFDGSQYLDLDPTKLPNGSTNFSYFFVTKTTNSGVYVFFSNGTTSTGRMVQCYFNNYNLYGDLYGGSAINDSTAYNNRYVIASYTAANTFNGYDFDNNFSTTNNIGITLNTATTYASVGVSRNASGLAFYLIGQIAEIICYNRVVSSDERQQIQAYLGWKWGLQTNFTASFPYISNRPFMNTYLLPVVITRPVFISNNPAVLPFGISTQIISLSWLPTRISGCTLWLDAADSSTVTLGSSGISSWKDKSTNSNTFTAVSSPAYSLKTQNGLNVVILNGTSQYFSSSFTINSATHTLIAVHKPNNSTSANTSLFRFQSGGTPYISFPYTSRGYITSYDGTALNFLNSTLLDNSVSSAFNLIAVTIQSGSQVVYLNGTSQATQNQSIPTSEATSPMILGAYKQDATTFSEFYGGTAAELLAFNSFLTTSQRQDVEGYLAWKWGIQSSLPNTHPYKLFPPSP